MHQRSAALVFMTVATVATARFAAADVSSGKDLKATIALNGLPCDQIVDVKRNADSDYRATCKDGNRYHIFVSAQGRVVVEKQ
ncbi:MAG: hypothetical protein M3O41_11485 [Pseudomonadota bacterium]|nr:hypothetical protein [Pseudomonadota bacterium]